MNSFLQKEYFLIAYFKPNVYDGLRDRETAKR